MDLTNETIRMAAAKGFGHKDKTGTGKDAGAFYAD
jgi:hypothetical protein